MTPSEQSVRISVNGIEHVLEVDPATPLLYVLRDTLGLGGPQFGCGLESCGACKVIVGADAVVSCRLPVGQVGDAPVTTIAGLMEDGDLHPVQQAFLDEQAVQCGYCINGMVMAAAALVMRQRPTEERIRQELHDNLCRCGTHVRIVRAVERAAEAIWGDA